jgi:hypothetical protein
MGKGPDGSGKKTGFISRRAEARGYQMGSKRPAIGAEAGSRKAGLTREFQAIKKGESFDSPFFVTAQQSGFVW